MSDDPARNEGETSEVRRLLRLIAEESDQHRCRQCAAHDEHEVCDAFDLARAIRKALAADRAAQDRIQADLSIWDDGLALEPIIAPIPPGLSGTEPDPWLLTFRVAIETAKKLIDEPHPGLSTWNSAMAHAVEELGKLCRR